MPKKHSTPRTSRTGNASASAPRIRNDPRTLERHLEAVARAIEQQGFTTDEEVNAFLATLNAGAPFPELAPETPLERAQELVYQAMEATGARRAKLVRAALDISPDCADAYVLLAEDAGTPEVAMPLYAQGVAAGERALGADMFENAAGQFWGIMETRPYMRARQGLAMTLWRMGQRAEAIAHAREMLRLNPGDNQGIRYLLSNWLLATSDNAGAGALLAQYPHDWSANWAYSRVLLAYRQSRTRTRAETALKKALEVNPYVPLILLGALPPPKQVPEYYGMGDLNEAVLYVLDVAQIWMEAPDALDWLARASLRLALLPRQRRPHRGAWTGPAIRDE